jgi:glycosyltransferase involved in cell wall biosynthesis
MKYLVAADMFFPDRPGGMGRVAWDIALLMRDRGHQVAFVTPDEFARPGTPPLAQQDGMQVLRYRRPRLSAFHPRRHHAAVRAAAEQARAAFGDQRWDVVHMHTPFTGEGVQRALGRGPRYIYTMHSPAVLEQRINWGTQGLSGRMKLLLGQGALRRHERRVLSECESIHTLSCFTRDRIEEFYGLGDRVRVIPHWRRPGMQRRCTKSQARRELGWPDDGPLFFTVRIHGPRYGIDDAIRAAAPLLAPRNARFAIGGDGPLTPAFKRLADELGCAERVRFTGRLSDEALALAYQAADLFVLPTRALECFGLITIEALSYGCPVLSTDAAAIPETMNLILPDFVVPAGDVQALRARMDDFLSGRLVAPPEEALVRFVAERFDAAVVTPQILALLEGSAGPGATGPAGSTAPHFGKA